MRLKPWQTPFVARRQGICQAGGALHTMAVLEAYQADLLKDQGHGLSPKAVAELCHTTDLALWATKQTVAAIGRSMVAVVMERHQWLHFFRIKEKYKYFLLDAPISPSGLFGTSIETVVERFKEISRRCIPCKVESRPSASLKPTDPSPGGSWRQELKTSVAAHAPHL